MWSTVSLVEAYVSQERVSYIFMAKRIRELLVTANVVPTSRILSTRKMEAIRSCETPVLTRLPWRHISGADILHRGFETSTDGARTMSMREGRTCGLAARIHQVAPRVKGGARTVAFTNTRKKLPSEMKDDATTGLETVHELKYEFKTVRILGEQMGSAHL
jgi:hypothetical protein